MEVVRALYAADAMQGVAGRRSPHSLGPVLLALIITAPRISALARLDVEDLDLAGARLLFGEGAGNKGTGAGYLDKRTCAELKDYVGDRTSGPLFLSPRGGRLDKANMLKDWRAIFSLALVDELWPDGEDRDFRTVYLVHLSLLKGQTVHVLGGGRKPGPEKRAARQRRKEHIARLVAVIRPAWEERMVGVDLHCFRKTARTWCLQEQVPDVFIDLQLGHVSQRGQDALSAFWSWTGQRHYTDF